MSRAAARRATRRHALALGLLAGAMLLPTGPARAVNPDEMLDDPALEARARALSKNLRCLVCRNQNIDDSNAELARDFRILLRERLKAGDSDEEAIAWLVERYGDYILLAPPLNGMTMLLWAGPALLLILAAGGFWITLKRRDGQAQPESEAPISAEDQALISRILQSDEVQK